MTIKQLDWLFSWGLLIGALVLVLPSYGVERALGVL